MFADAFDGLHAGMYLVEADAHLLHANIAGRALIDAGDILHEVRGRLLVSDLPANLTLQCAFAAAGQADRSPAAVPMTGRDGQRYVADALPLPAGTRRNSGANRRAAAALFVRKTALPIPSRAEVISKAFRLTPAELRVLLALVELGGIPEVAAALGVAGSTVKTHVRRLFDKTGAARQADLVKIVAGYATPLRELAKYNPVGAPP
ncbi:helix-turn-helix transcriptional regulator [Bradyrhizobium symbiodeficiens]|uniref:Helix-turn-helix transcriptional regulator n=1 Tax=Bradyrhizobium symbiodeficiens TaxID=1404367 RepID=A0ABX5WLE7_9BRAD|nr:helix-turn-helix transcriptional regulator [Bradyrhizobium symbiodeficiens]